MRNMSFFLTQDQLLDGSKTVTRRLGWQVLKAGDRFRAVRKVQGLKKGEGIDALAECEVIGVRRERLDAIDQADCTAEGFPAMTPSEFVDMFCKAMGCEPDTEVTRVEFRVVEPSAMPEKRRSGRERRPARE